MPVMTLILLGAYVGTLAFSGRRGRVWRRPRPLLFSVIDDLGFVEKSNPVAAMVPSPGLVDVKGSKQAYHGQKDVCVEQPELGTGGEADEQEQQADRQPDMRDAGIKPVGHQHRDHPAVRNSFE